MHAHPLIHKHTHSHSLSCRHSRYSPSSHKAFRINLLEKQGGFNSDITYAHTAINLTSNLKKSQFLFKKKKPPPFFFILSFHIFHSLAGQPYLSLWCYSRLALGRNLQAMLNKRWQKSDLGEQSLLPTRNTSSHLMACCSFPVECAAWQTVETLWDLGASQCGINSPSTPTPPSKHTHTHMLTQSFGELCIGSSLKV